MKADPSRQWRLLDLVDLDTRAAQLKHRRTVSPEAKALTELEARAGLLDNDLVRARTAAGDIQREVDRAENDVQLVRDRLSRNQSRLESGTGSAKDLQALQHENASLERRQSALEDVELEVMERAEAAAAEVTRLEAERSELGDQIGAATAERDRVFGEIDLEEQAIAGRRPDVVAGVGADLVALYDKIAAQVGGAGAAALKARRCEGCHMELNQVDLAAIRSATEDDVVRCEECRRILVRTAESGL
ncbi:C4-type zinc ribbon domain-containing protein [Arsenicicoccus piscis]|uniref:C4-type zinc ribbon domain-containing protein n=1 Tax=Arsenicicoccus piscis TaxID=673954 RepID=A0ABQ6HNF8_9MICO|nr:C4-type zinc ribbon domain-containing protein [Arsenicicoccus piscis]MCH8628449.1 C4-type zinc ribbon domain-containing protein [Arsenicicoccus piscis]GMA19989.1 hypothetical protein GCM10025862_20100 [Arsenicicoccus piscis]